MSYISVIGLEIHAELNTKKKIFCSCENAFNRPKNTCICPICMGMPGALPVLNEEAVGKAVKACLALNCGINQKSSFDRKNYFYPDLPKGYQITQYYEPISRGGAITLKKYSYEISRIHIEEDAGKLIYDSKKNCTEIDYNRCGVPLIEIVTAPDFREAEEVCEFVAAVARRLQYAGVCDARLEEGSLRVDVNISVKNRLGGYLGTRCEIKNLNSLKSIKRAIEYEYKRQIEILEKGKNVLCETRRYDEKSGTTVRMRNKEKASEYRYIPEPDLLPIYFGEEHIKKIEKELPTMPEELYERYTEDYRLPKKDAELISDDMECAEYFGKAVRVYPSYRAVANIMLGEMKRQLKKNTQSLSECSVTPKMLAQITQMYEMGEITKAAVGIILEEIFAFGGEPMKIAEEKGLFKVNDKKMITEAIEKVFEENGEAVRQYKNGNQKIVGFLMGQVMHSLPKSADPREVTLLLFEKLDR